MIANATWEWSAGVEVQTCCVGRQIPDSAGSAADAKPRIHQNQSDKYEKVERRCFEEGAGSGMRPGRDDEDLHPDERNSNPGSVTV